MPKIVLLRHGESLWNQANKFTGWTDVALSENGQKEAQQAGELLKKHGYTFDQAYTSLLKRAIKTLWITLEEMDLMWLPVERSWRLNERHYGILQGLNKEETREKYGKEQVFIWRRSYDTPPPPLKDSPKDSRYDQPIPLSESLKDCQERVLPFWKETILPAVQANKKILIVAHGNSLRALIKSLDQVSNEEITGIEIPTGQPLVYEVTPEGQSIKSYYLNEKNDRL